MRMVTQIVLRKLILDLDLIQQPVTLVVRGATIRLQKMLDRPIL